MRRKKLRLHLTKTETILSYGALIKKKFIRRINSLLLHNVLHKTLKTLRTKHHSSVGRSKGTICVRSKKHRNHLYFSRGLLDKSSFNYRFVSLKYNAISPNTVSGIVIGNNNVLQYYSLPQFSSTGDSFFRLHSKLRFFDQNYFTKISKVSGNTMPLSLIPNGSFIYNIEQIPGKGPCYARSPGSFAQLLLKQQLRRKQYALVAFPSKVNSFIPLNCEASLGRTASVLKNIYETTNAGFQYRRGKRPKVRGVAMNPIDHPHGGGEGKKSKSVAPKNPWGTISRGGKTLSKEKKSKKSKFILRMKRFAFNVS